MQTIVLTRRRVLLGALVLALVLVVGARFIVRAGSPAGPGAPPIIGSAAAGAAARRGHDAEGRSERREPRGAARRRRAGARTGPIAGRGGGCRGDGRFRG